MWPVLSSIFNSCDYDDAQEERAYFCVFSFFCVCPHCAICFGKSFNVTSVIKHFQQLWLWKSIRRWSMFFFFYSLYCWGSSSGVPTVLYASSVLGPNSRFGIRIRSIVFPCTFSIALTSVSSTISIALTSEHSQLYFHVQCTFSNALRSG